MKDAKIVICDTTRALINVARLNGIKGRLAKADIVQ